MQKDKKSGSRLLNYCSLLITRPKWFLRLVLSRMLVATRLCMLFNIEMGGITLRFFPTRYSADLWFPDVNIYDEYHLPLLRDGDTVIDVGANMGVMTLLFVKCGGPTGRG